MPFALIRLDRKRMHRTRPACPTVVELGCVLLGVLVSCMACAANAVAAADAPRTTDESAVLAQIRDAAMSSDWGWQRLADLTDKIGPRLSGSLQLAAAINQLAAAMRSLPAQVTLQPVKVPHWIRGEEQAELIDYPGRPAGVAQRLHLTALGNSAATAEAGLTPRRIVVHEFDELKARSAEVIGNVVLFESRFDQRLADNGDAPDAYRQNGAYRFTGPSTAAEFGGAAP